MTEYVYPTTDNDRPRNMLAVLGAFWAEVYSGREQIDSMLRAKGQVENQTNVDLLALMNSLARTSVPIYHADNWYALSLLKSEVNSGDIALAKFDGTLLFNAGSQFDVPQDRATYGYPITADLANANLVMNRFAEPSLMWVDGQDFVLEPGAIIFRSNPFDDPRVATRPVYEDGVVVDTEAVVWIFKGQFDFDTIYRQYGYVIGLRLQSSKGYRDLMTAFFEALVGGTTRRNLELAAAAMTGIPLVLEPTEVVEHVSIDRNHRLVITDQHVYRFNTEVIPTVAVGDVVTAGQTLVDAMEFIELNRGTVPDDLLALAMGKGFLATCYYGDLIFENKDVPLEVTEAADTEDGFTRVQFGLGGFPLDVQQFFDDMHERGVAVSQLPVDDCDPGDIITVPGSECDDIEDQKIRVGTLAHLLDTRPAKIGEPTAAALPSVINPLQFLVENVLRANAAIIRVRVKGLGSAGVGLHNATLLRKIVPPHTVVILVIELTPEKDSITVDQIGETMSTFPAMSLVDPVTENMVNDSKVGIRVVFGTCQ